MLRTTYWLAVLAMVACGCTQNAPPPAAKTGTGSVAQVATSDQSSTLEPGDAAVDTGRDLAKDEMPESDSDPSADVGDADAGIGDTGAGDSAAGADDTAVTDESTTGTGDDATRDDKPDAIQSEDEEASDETNSVPATTEPASDDEPAGDDAPEKTV
ncbi:MAG TPA: hypothetical protein VND64_09885, partial [Pirellulales bacterium]|nr:hypothetical protein [Pirellulales bacterium]